MLRRKVRDVGGGNGHADHFTQRKQSSRGGKQWQSARQQVRGEPHADETKAKRDYPSSWIPPGDCSERQFTKNHEHTVPRNHQTVDSRTKAVARNLETHA